MSWDSQVLCTNQRGATFYRKKVFIRAIYCTKILQKLQEMRISLPAIHIFVFSVLRPGRLAKLPGYCYTGFCSFCSGPTLFLTPNMRYSYARESFYKLHLKYSSLSQRMSNPLFFSSLF